MGRILVVDRDRHERARLQALMTGLGHELFSADNSATVLTVVRERLPNLVVLDVEIGGLMLCREIIELSDATAVILTSSERTKSSDRVAGLLAGADDYVCRPFDPDELLARAMRTLARHTHHSTSSSSPPSLSTLSPREHEVLSLLAKGLTHREIARNLVISPKTVATHVQHILSKLGLHSRAQAVAYAFTDDSGDVDSAKLSGGTGSHPVHA